MLSEVAVLVPVRGLVAETAGLAHVFDVKPSRRPYKAAKLAKRDDLVGKFAGRLLDEWVIAISDKAELAALAERLGLSSDECHFQVHAADALRLVDRE